MKTLLIALGVHAPLMVATWLALYAGAAGLREIGDVLR